MTAFLRSLMREPRVPDPPSRTWRDWVIVAAAIVTVTAEAVWRTDLAWPLPAAAVAVFAIVPILVRHRHPLGALLAAFGVTTGASVVWIVVADALWDPYSVIVVLILPYALVRWGSGRQIAIGLIAMLVTWAVNVAIDFTGAVEAIAGLLFFFLAAELGAVMRYRTQSREREVQQARDRERELIARELHDTVAHHVSAIAVQAQAGRAVAATSPDAAEQALAVIEEAASRTLTEMRTMVGTLRRSDDSAALAPQQGIPEIATLAAMAPRGMTVAVDMHGPVAGVRPSVDAALFRIAQESVTNAVRHARHATRVEVQLDVGPRQVRLRVHDDGRASTGGRADDGGYGVIGMRERAVLLGGTLTAGPDPVGGWTVTATFPRPDAT